MIKYFGGQHSIYVSPKTLATYYTDAKPNCAPTPNPIPNPVPSPYSRHLLHRRETELCAHS